MNSRRKLEQDQFVKAITQGKYITAVYLIWILLIISRCNINPKQYQKYRHSTFKYAKYYSLVRQLLILNILMFVSFN